MNYRQKTELPHKLLYVISVRPPACSDILLLFGMDTLLRQYVVGHFPGHLDSALSPLRTLLISFRDSNLPQTLPPEELHIFDLILKS